ncbi:hypothetical protein CVT24_004801 [Panaeolus cyanescens]|uniref:Uncharacterized protein n=1 Tax=Panaeolus cyanescens TaxID=181874 RepID=A0A409VQ24_9AGAR|nr:hypothetical protein CVT24_004801 [Panaeolus cyanescens]
MPSAKSTTTQPQAATQMTVMNAPQGNSSQEQHCEHGKHQKASRIRGGGAAKVRPYTFPSLHSEMNWALLFRTASWAWWDASCASNVARVAVNAAQTSSAAHAKCVARQWQNPKNRASSLLHVVYQIHAKSIQL